MKVCNLYKYGRAHHVLSRKKIKKYNNVLSVWDTAIVGKNLSSIEKIHIWLKLKDTLFLLHVT